MRKAKPATLEAAYQEAVEMENDLDSYLLPDTRYKDYGNAPRPWNHDNYSAQGSNGFHEYPRGPLPNTQPLNSRRARFQDP